MIRKLLLATLSLYAGLAAALPPHRVSLQYELSYNGIVAATLTEVLQHDGKQFSLVSEGRGQGIGALLYRGAARRSCSGEITRSGLRPIEYRDQRGDKPAAVARFDWVGKRLTQEHDGKPEVTELSRGMQDRLSFLYDFAFQASPEFAAGREIKAVLTDGKGLTRFQYRVAGTEILDTPAGKLDTVRLVKQRDNQDDKATELWFARERHFLPVRILVVEKDGTRIDQMLTRIEEQ